MRVRRLRVTYEQWCSWSEEDGLATDLDQISHSDTILAIEDMVRDRWVENAKVIYDTGVIEEDDPQEDPYQNKYLEPNPSYSIRQPEAAYADLDEYVRNHILVAEQALYQPWEETEGVYEFVEWCVSDTLSTTGCWPSKDEFWAYYHAAHVHMSGGPIA